MEQLQTTANQLANTTTNIELVKQIYHVNYLIPYPLNDIMIEGWAKSLQELEPAITPNVIKWIIDKSKIGLFEWDHKKGIQNIFNGFRDYISFQLDLQRESGFRGESNWNVLFKKYRRSKDYVNLSGQI